MTHNNSRGDQDMSNSNTPPSWLARPVAPHRPEHDDPEIRDAQEQKDSESQDRKRGAEEEVIKLHSEVKRRVAKHEPAA